VRITGAAARGEQQLLPPPDQPDESYLAFYKRWIATKESGRKAMEAKTDDLASSPSAKLRAKGDKPEQNSSRRRAFFEMPVSEYGYRWLFRSRAIAVGLSGRAKPDRV